MDLAHYRLKNFLWKDNKEVRDVVGRRRKRGKNGWKERKRKKEREEGK